MPATLERPSTRIEKELTVLNEHGLHARPAADFVRCAARFSSTIRILARGQEYSAKRVVDILFANLNRSFTFTLIAEGPDAAVAVAALDGLLAEIAAGDVMAREGRLQSVRDLFVD